MSWKKLELLIANALEEVSEEDLDRLRALLREPRGDGIKPDRFRAAIVEGKTAPQLARLLSRTFSDKTEEITIKLLRTINCNHAANQLEAAVRLPPAPVWDVSRTYPRPSTTEHSDRQQPASGRKRSTTPPASEAAAVEEAPVNQGHFVDRHRVNLIKRVFHVRPILDYLLKEEVLQQEQYDRALEISTRKDQMMFLYDGPLKSGGERSKDVLMAALCIQESCLMQDLWKNEGST